MKLVNTISKIKEITSGMNQERINQLKTFLENTPNDPFVLHALGLEYKSYQPETAAKYFAQALEADSNYIGTYYHLAETYTALEQFDKAKKTYESGIAVAEKLNDQKTLAELKNAFQNFLIENDDLL